VSTNPTKQFPVHLRDTF